MTSVVTASAGSAFVAGKRRVTVAAPSGITPLHDPWAPFNPTPPVICALVLPQALPPPFLDHRFLARTGDL